MSRRTLAAAYRRTVYRAELPEGALELRVGERSPALAGALAARGAGRWGWLTAENPGSRRLPPEENRARTARLAAELAAHGWSFVAGAAIDPRGEWPAEASFLVFDPPPRRLATLARRHGQLAFLAGEAGSPVRLRFLAPARARRGG